MNRRHFFRQAVGLSVLPLAGWALGGCSSPQPDSIRLGESSCAYCRQRIADPRFAAQIRDAQGVHHVFDDVGCAVRWIQAQGLADETLTFWVMDFRGGYWVDAFKAHFHAGEASPRGYDLAASTIPGNGGQAYDEARQGILARPQ